MALSNKFGSLVLSTGNKSEMAVGYCTLYGDMAGGLAVISDVPKTMVYDLARFVNRREGADSRGDSDEGPIGRIAAESDRPGLAAPVRGSGPDSEGICRGYAEPRADCRGVPAAARAGAVRGAAGGPKRIQAETGAAGAEGNVKGVQRGKAIPGGAEIFGLGRPQTPRTFTNSRTEAADLSRAALSSGESFTSMICSTPLAPSFTGTPTNSPLIPYSPSR